MDDISDDTTTSLSQSEIDNEDIQDRIQARRFRSIVFYGSSIIIVLFLTGLFTWLVAFPFDDLIWHDGAALKSIGNFIASHAITGTIITLGIVILAALPTTMGLALLRFSFNSGKGKPDEKDMPGVWLSLAKELADVVKDYLKSRK
ncbi:hypothetical protein ACEV6Q_08370 [Enterobacter ludwigii]|uniref:hypothetical protein n=1 Tax=Enterobacter ludwigii TaxID=299767 RepID=UPI003BEEDF3F